MRAAFLVGSLCLALAAACQAPTDTGTAGRAGECVKCHNAEFREAKAPVHLGEKPTTCGICHVESAWRPSRLEHPWPLTGAHARGHCFYCHHGDEPVFRGTRKECIDCHRSEYEKAPQHEHNPTTCETCHSTAAWSPPLPNHPPSPRPAEALDAGPEPDAAPSPSLAHTTKPPKPRPTSSGGPSPAPTPTPKPDTTTGPSRRWPH